MSLYGGMFSGVSGLNAQGSAMAMVADNISNINTDGYKGSEAVFSTLITESNGAKGYSSGGVTSEASQKINKQGLVKTTGEVTDLAITGRGFFAVNGREDLKGDYLYTRAGSFGKDSRGRLVNKSGYYLLAWPLDSSNRLPGEPGNLNTTSSALLDSLEVVNIGTISGNASQTTTVDLGMNLKASEKLLKGIGKTISFPTNSVNYKAKAKDVIAPDGTTGLEMNIGDTLTLTPSSPGQAYVFTYGGLVQSSDITGTILGASTAQQVFTAATNDDGLTITTNVSGTSTTYTYTYKAASPTTANGEFNSLQTLAEAINTSAGIIATIRGNFLHIANEDANEAVTFANTGAGGSNFATSLGLIGGITAAGAGVYRYASLQDLANKISAQPGLETSVTSPLDSTKVEFYARDPLGTLTVAATGSLGPPVSSSASIIAQLGITNLTSGDILASSYSSTDNKKNFSGGKITPQFSRNVRVYDALGTGHDFRVNFGKIDDNKWTVEVAALNKSEIVTNRTDGQVTEGTIEFNGDGTLRSVSANLINPVQIVWANKAVPSSIKFNWGTAGEVASTFGATQIGKADGLRQLDSAFSVDFVNQNGISAGLLSGVEIGSSGIVTAKFTNGTSRDIYKIPLADFTSINNLESRAGNVYAETTQSGNFNLKQADNGGVGKLQPGSLEQANVELSDELTRMIVAQRGYQANSKVIKTVNEMLEDLNRLF